jgi:hypothetical protein
MTVQRKLAGILQQNLTTVVIKTFKNDPKKKEKKKAE